MPEGNKGSAARGPEPALAGAEVRFSSGRVERLGGVERIPLGAKIAWTHQLIKHAVALILLVTLVLAPFIFIAGMKILRADGVKEFPNFFQTWFGVVAGLAGTAVGWYFRGKKETQ
jgi:hypothetical protein